MEISTMKNNTTQMRKSEQEAKALDITINILMAFTLTLLGFASGYYYAVVRLTAILNN
jgi:hypothetical protein